MSLEYDVNQKSMDCVHYNEYNKDNDEIDISIVMTTHNRKVQTLFTLETINYNAIINKDKGIRIQVILVDDSNSENYLTEKELVVFSYPITYITIEHDKKRWINPCVNYNIGFNEVKGKNVIIQNAEVCHIGNIIHCVHTTINDNTYMSFDVMALRNAALNDVVYTEYNKDKSMAYDNIIKVLSLHGNELAWYQHHIYRNANMHFLTAISKTNLLRLRGFDYDFAQGIFYDDNEFIDRIVYVLRLRILCIPSNVNKLLGIHLWHDGGTNILVTNKELGKINEIIYNYKKRVCLKWH